MGFRKKIAFVLFAGLALVAVVYIAQLLCAFVFIIALVVPAIFLHYYDVRADRRTP